MTRGIPLHIRRILLGTLALLASLHSPALAEPDGDLQTLDMFYEGEDLVVTATRNPQPISRTAENITVITAAEIEMMGAHTLTDVLSNVPGIQIQDYGSVGTVSYPFIQGAGPTQILVLQDGITLNYIGEGSVDIGAIPVQQIERIEIVKGPGSSSWGSALGGVINIVTKSPDEAGKLGGTLSFSGGERGTRDSRGEATGTIGPFGYFLSAGNLTSAGFHPHTDASENNLYAKLRWELPARGSLLYTLAYSNGSRGEGQSDTYGFFAADSYNYFLSTLALTYPLNDHADLDVSLRTTARPTDITANILDTGELLQLRTVHESTLGGSAKVIWRAWRQSLAVGTDFDHIRFDYHSSSPTFVVSTDQHFTSDKWGIYLNDAVTLGQITVTPGVRFDRMPQTGNFISPSLGAAWCLNDLTVLRAYAGRGYSLPFIIPGATQEKVIAIQAGAETSQIPWLWLKTTLFRNYLSDVTVDYDANGLPILGRQQKQGVEVEARTIPLFNTALSAGYTFVDATDKDTGKTVPDIPSQIVKLGLHYDDKRSLRGTLLGRYFWWNGAPGDFTKDKAIIWDLNLAKKVLNFQDTTLELFFNAHNIFNGAQFSNPYDFENARRWLEGGIRCNF